jgi:hypothetical protein
MSVPALRAAADVVAGHDPSTSEATVFNTIHAELAADHRQSL